jgi:hypothetical protein
MLRHETVYDLTTAGFQFLEPVAIPIIFIGIAILLYVFRDSQIVRYLNRWYPDRWRTLFPIAFGGFASIILAFFLIPALSQYVSLREAVSHRKYVEVVGPIDNFQVWVPHGRPESFTVNGTPFSFFGANVAPGFEDTDYPLRNGECVRIWRVEDVIVRLDKVVEEQRSSCHG